MKVAVCGLGKMGLNHKRKYEQLGCDVVVYDPGLKKYNDFDKFLKEDFTHVSICSPTDTHVSNALTILNEKTNVYVLVEKPISHSIRQAEELLKYSDRVFVGHVERFNPIVNWLKKFSKDIYSLKLIRVNNTPSRELNDVALDLMIHDADLINFILNFKDCDSIRNNKTAFKNIEIVDHATMYGVFGGTHVYCESSWLSPFKQRVIEFICLEGSGRIDLIKQNGFFIDFFGIKNKIEIYECDPLLAELSSFSGYPGVNFNILCSVEDAINALKLVK